MRSSLRSVLVLLGMLLTVGVAHPTVAVALPVQAADPCVLPPGIYTIEKLHPDGRLELVGVLIVYPDCRTEILPIDHIPVG